MTFNSGSTAHRCQSCKPVFVASAGKAPIYNVDLAVKSPAETHFRQICIFHDPQNKLVSETNWQMFFYFDFRLILKQLVQIDSMFSLKYFCRRNLSPIAFLARKNSKRAPARFASLTTTLRTLSDIYKYMSHQSSQAAMIHARQNYKPSLHEESRNSNLVPRAFPSKNFFEGKALGTRLKE